MRPLSWIVGLDTTERCVGALRWAAWLQGNTQPPGHVLVGVHVVEPARLAFTADTEPDDTAIIDRLRAFLTRHGVGELLASIDVVRAGSAARGLVDLAARTGAGLLLGRAARSHAWSLTALGSTARRVLRELPGPVCVVPPDHEPPARPAADAHPVVLALEDDETCIDAARMAVRLSRGMGCAAVGVHALPAIDPMKQMPESSIAYESFPTTDQDFVRLERVARDRFAQWFRRHDLDGIELRLEHGKPARIIDEAAARDHACVIVCGSRRLSLTSRLFITSVGTDLAAHAARPVMIVPPGWTEPR